MTLNYALAAAVHDPQGHIVPAVERLAEVLRGTFHRFVLNISDQTSEEVVAAVRYRLGARVIIHPASEASIGRVRRDAVAGAAPDPVLYCDFDHLLRWIEHGPDSLQQVLRQQPDIDFLVVGRSSKALEAGPERLRQTERLVNHTYELLTGDQWDLMFAVRRMSGAAAKIVVTQSIVDTLANDVEWPLLARAAGLGVGYAECEHLLYRTIEEFGAMADSGDADPLQWIRRLEFAALHATAMRRFVR